MRPITCRAIEPLEQRFFLSAGNLDPTFGVDGKVLDSNPTLIGGEGRNLFLQPDGKLVVAGITGNVPLIGRFLPDGQPDPSFGGGTGLAFAPNVYMDTSSFPALTVQSDGKIVIGTHEHVVRFNTDGTLDTSFGAGGVFTFNYDGLSTQVSSIDLESDGSFLISGSWGTNFVLYHLTSNGTRDANFGSNGRAVVSWPGQIESRAVAAERLTDGKIFAVANVVVPDGSTSREVTGLARFLPDGNPDNGFDGDGKAGGVLGTMPPSPYQARFLPDGRAVICTCAHTVGVTLARYQTNGSLDSGFGTAGIATLNQPFMALNLDVANDGGVAVVGIHRFGTPSTTDAFLARFTPQGVPDLTLASSGFVEEPTSAFNKGYWSVAMRPDRSMVAVAASNFSGASYSPTAVVLHSYMADGSQDTSVNGTGEVAWKVPSSLGIGGRASIVQSTGKVVTVMANDTIIRHNLDGTLDTTFGLNGKAKVDVGPGQQEFFTTLVQLPDGSLLAGGEYPYTVAGDWFFARFDADGHLDTTFGSGGVRRYTEEGNYGPEHLAVLSDGRFMGAAGRTVLRFMPNGDIDHTLDAVHISLDNSKFIGNVADIIPLADGSFYLLTVVEQDGPSSNRRLRLYRFTSNGQLDNSFGTGGLANASSNADCPRAMVLRPDGRILVTGDAQDLFAPGVFLAQFNTNGQPDTTFGSNGRALLPAIPAKIVPPPTALLLQNDGKAIVLQGDLTMHNIFYHDPSVDFTITRFNTNGSVDTTFGKGGTVTTDFDSGNDVAAGMAIYQGRYLTVSGSAYITPEPASFFPGAAYHVALARYDLEDHIPPTVTSASFDYQIRQAVSIHFSEDVKASLSQSDLRLTNLSTGQSFTATSAVFTGNSGEASSADWIFTQRLPDGTYEAALSAADVADVVNNPMAADFKFNFPILAGDLDGNGRVTISDFITLSSNFGKTNATYSDGDLNYDHQVTIADFIDLAVNFNNSLPPPAPAALAQPADALEISAASSPGPMDETLLAAKPALAKARHAKHHRKPHQIFRH